MREIMAKPITARAFSPFGVLLAAAGATTAHRFNAPNSETRLETVLSQTPPQREYCTIRVMEKHAFSTQAFFPLHVDRYLVVVCPAGAEAPDLARVQAFWVPGDSAVQYHQGAWHCNMAALGRPGLFVNLVQKNDTTDDCTYIDVDPFRVRLPDAWGSA